jgi:hypothetical protein
MRSQVLALAALLASPLLAGAATNLVSNGSFEANAQGQASWSIRNTLDGWNVGGLGVELRNGVSGGALDGSNFIELDTTGNSWISQSFATVAGQTYLLSFSYAQRPDNKGVASNGIAWSAGSVSQAVVGQDLSTAWTTVNSSFVATGTSTTLSFSALGSSDSYGTSLDKISVSAVPEPQTYALMLAGLAAVGLIARRRKTC